MKTNNKILIITLQRTGGSIYCINLAKTLGIINLREFLNPWVIDTSLPEYDKVEDIDKFNYLTSANDWVLKLMSTDVEFYIRSDENRGNMVPGIITNKKRPWGGLEFYKKLINISTEHIFLYRKNFKDQVISLASAHVSDTFGSDRKDLSVSISDEHILYAQTALINGYYIMKDMYELFPGKIIAYEDFATADSKYPDYKSVEGNFDIIEDFDVYNEVFGQ